jgi:hypothetical protein
MQIYLPAAGLWICIAFIADPVAALKASADPNPEF